MIVDFVYYELNFNGSEAPECDFPALCARAEDVVGSMTRWQVTEANFPTLSAFQKEMARKAICAQIDFFAVNGLDAVNGDAGRGFTVGKVSISGQSGGGQQGKMAGNIAPMARMYLEQSGLLNPSVPVM